MISYLKSLFEKRNKAKKMLKEKKLQEKMLEEKMLEEKILKEKKLQEKELREKKLEEKRKISKFTNEVKKNYYVYNNFIPSMYKELDSKSKIYLEKYNDDSITMKMFLEIYKDTIDVNSIYELKKVVNKQYIRDIINKYFDIEKKLIESQHRGDLNLKADNALKVIDTTIQIILDKEKYDEIIKLFFLDKEVEGNGYYIMRNFGLTARDVEKTLNNSYDSLSSYYTLGTLCVNECSLFLYIYSIIKLIVIYRVKYSILNNIELKIIFYNLYNEFKDLDIVYEKINKIYNMEYFTDEDKLNQIELKSLIKFLIIDEENNLNNYNLKYDIETIRNEIKDGIYTENIFNILKHIILNEDNIKYRSITDNFEEIIYISLLNILRLEINYLDLIKMYRDKEKILKNIKKIIDEIDTLKIKKRILNNNFIPVNSIDKRKLDIKNVNNGHEFEWYLEYIFKSLGYGVEVTKGSGDQGADLIIKKSGTKYVVQAKFYSSPVTNKAIQEVVASIKYYNANKAMVVTNSTFTDSAIELAFVNDVEMIDGKELKKIIDKLKKSI